MSEKKKVSDDCLEWESSTETFKESKTYTVSVNGCRVGIAHQSPGETLNDLREKFAKTLGMVNDDWSLYMAFLKSAENHEVDTAAVQDLVKDHDLLKVVADELKKSAMRKIEFREVRENSISTLHF